MTTCKHGHNGERCPTVECRLDRIERKLSEKPRWEYRSFNVGGNLHYLRDYLNEHEPHADIVAVHVSGGNCSVLVRELMAESRKGDG